jgi:hypothetical protein
LPKGNRAEAPSKAKAMETNESRIHIGHLIHEQLRQDKRSVGWLSRQIPCSRNHVYKIFNKPSLDSDLILRISNAMNFNFFQYYTAEFLENLRKRTGEENA